MDRTLQLFLVCFLVALLWRASAPPPVLIELPQAEPARRGGCGGLLLVALAILLIIGLATPA